MLGDKFDILVEHVESGKTGVLQHLDSPYCPPNDGLAYWECVTAYLMGLLMSNQPWLFKYYGIAATPIILGLPNRGKSTALASAAHMSSTPARIYSAETTWAFLKQDKAGSTLWNAVDDNDKCKKEEVIGVAGKHI